jgi:hypothetical protein
MRVLRSVSVRVFLVSRERSAVLAHISSVFSAELQNPSWTEKH